MESFEFLAIRKAMTFDNAVETKSLTDLVVKDYLSKGSSGKAFEI